MRLDRRTGQGPATPSTRRRASSKNQAAGADQYLSSSLLIHVTSPRERCPVHSHPRLLGSYGRRTSSRPRGGRTTLGTVRCARIRATFCSSPMNASLLALSARLLLIARRLPIVPLAGVTGRNEQRDHELAVLVRLVEDATHDALGLRELFDLLHQRAYHQIHGTEHRSSIAPWRQDMPFGLHSPVRRYLRSHGIDQMERSLRRVRARTGLPPRRRRPARRRALRTLSVP